MGAALHVTLLISALLLAEAPTAFAEETTPEAERLARAALDLCMRADTLADGERRGMLRRGLGLAERAVANDEALSRAHFAVFCTLGKLVDLDCIGWRTLTSVRRVRQAAERAVALDPNDVEALVGKGALLTRLPRLLGGDEAEGRRCLTRALEMDPWHATARTYLSRLGTVPVVPAPATLSAVEVAE